MTLFLRKHFLMHLVFIVSFVVPWERTLAFQGSSLNLYFIFILFVFVPLWVLNGARLRLVNTPFLFFGAFVFWGFLTYLWTENEAVTQAEGFAWFGLLLLLLVVSSVLRSMDDVRRVVAVFVFGCGVVGIIIFITVVSEFGTGVTQGRSALGGQNPNWLAAPLAAGIPLLFALVVERARLKKVYFVLLVFCFIAVLLSGSRAAVLASSLGLMVAAFLLIKNNERVIGVRAFKFVLFFVVFSGAGLFFAWVGGLGAGRVDRIFEFLSNPGQSGLGLRGTIFWLYIEAIQNRPWVGYGLGVRHEATTLGYSPHNGYLSIALGSGLVGLSFFLLYLLSALRYSYQVSRNSALGAGAFGAIIGVSVIFMTTANENNKYLVLVVALVVAMNDFSGKYPILRNGMRHTVAVKK